MSSKLIKNGMGLVVPDEVYLELVVSREGVKLKSPLPPNEVCKLLHNITVDLMFANFQQAEASKIQTPM